MNKMAVLNVFTLGVSNKLLLFIIINLMDIVINHRFWSHTALNDRFLGIVGTKSILLKQLKWLFCAACSST